MSLARWSFWSPRHAAPADWVQSWQQDDARDEHGEPVADRVPPMHRRRMSRLSKMAVQAALSVTEEAEPNYVIFTSRHGEIVRTRRLLSSLAAGEELSPTEFSQSVHNTGVGLYSIIRHSQAPAAAIASGAASFASGWLDAEGYLAEHPGDTVLLVDSDDLLPVEYAPFVSQVRCAYALAMLLVSVRSGGVALAIAKGDSNESQMPIGPRVLGWLLSSEPALSVDAEGQAFVWKRFSDGA